MTRGRSMERGPSGSQNHGRSKYRSKINLKCYNCGKKGHLKRDCWFKKNGEKSFEASSSQGCVSNTYDDGEILYSGETTGSKGSTAKIKMYDGTVCIIQEVQHMKGLKKNLLSIGELDNLRDRLWDPTSRKVIVIRDVIFAENELQREQENDSTAKDINIVHIDGKSVEDDSFEAEPEHEVQEP
ncbi:hypothetical protein KIW84_053721 [Lathyrus oleraceus]|uniref:CCHC-type domain-containing protein n=1 Tax=Pisum sativum TaxID=3888 RepID=A0A9D5AH56_PEA|nr:hypothetical protein KIW84_053721 [Pisum sativum]